MNFLNNYLKIKYTRIMAYLNQSGLSHYDEKIKEYIGSHAGTPKGSEITGYSGEYTYEPYGGVCVMPATGGPVVGMPMSSFASYIGSYISGSVVGSQITGFGTSTYEPYGGVAIMESTGGPVAGMSLSDFASYLGSYMTGNIPDGSQIDGYSGLSDTSFEKIGVFTTTGGELFEVGLNNFVAGLGSKASWSDNLAATGTAATSQYIPVIGTGGELMKISIADFKAI